MKLCMKSVKFHLGMVLPGNLSMLSEILLQLKVFEGESISTCVAFTKKLHSHDSEYKDDDTEDESEVTKSTNGFPHDGD